MLVRVLLQGQGQVPLRVRLQKQVLWQGRVLLRLTALLGYAPDELLGRRLDHLVSEDVRYHASPRSTHSASPGR